MSRCYGLRAAANMPNNMQLDKLLSPGVEHSPVCFIAYLGVWTVVKQVLLHFLVRGNLAASASLPLGAPARDAVLLSTEHAHQACWE